MDVLADVLSVLRLRTNAYFCSEFMGSWGMDIADGAGTFHAVIDGECWLTQKNNTQPIRLVAGDVVAFPTGANHSLSNHDTSQEPDSIDSHTGNHTYSHINNKLTTHSERESLPGSEVVERVQAGDNPFLDGEHSVTLLCGSFEYDTSIDHPFLQDLPCFIQIKNEDNQETWLHPFIEALASESRSAKTGSSVIVHCLTEILFVQLMRAYMQQAGGHEFRYMSALVHPQMGVALRHIHNDLNAQCSVEKLAAVVAMSRTTFTDKFTRIVGVSPKKYIINWRMQKAKKQLETGQEAMIVIAENAGYNSESAFNKAYKQFFGTTPGASRSVQ